MKNMTLEEIIMECKEEAQHYEEMFKYYKEPWTKDSAKYQRQLVEFLEELERYRKLDILSRNNVLNSCICKNVDSNCNPSSLCKECQAFAVSYKEILALEKVEPNEIKETL